jgi:hypothetical protein
VKLGLYIVFCSREDRALSVVQVCSFQFCTCFVHGEINARNICKIDSCSVACMGSGEHMHAFEVRCGARCAAGVVMIMCLSVIVCLLVRDLTLEGVKQS